MSAAEAWPGPPGCECDLALPARDRCTKTGWIRCNGALNAQNAQYAKRRGEPVVDWEGRARAAEALLNAPEIIDFVRAVRLEAAHQRARWPSEHDSGKTDADWFWLIGYLAGKALYNPGGGIAKQLHRIVTVAAAACNWHAAKLGQTNMRPGIDTPTEDAP